MSWAKRRPTLHAAAVMRPKPDTRFRIRIPETDLASWAKEYPKEEDILAEQIGASARERGHLLLPELRELARWKSQRIGRRIDANRDSVVQEVTRLALGTDDPGLAIRALQLLDGVGWPMASVILHFCSRERYPVLDVRAIWTVGYDKLPSYTTTFWAAYTSYCRNLSDRTGLSMRDVDRGLWQYSDHRGKMALPR